MKTDLVPSGGARLRHFTRRTAVGLIVIAGAGAGFGLLLLLVRLRWGPLHHLDHEVAEHLNAWVAPDHRLVTVLEAISSAGGRTTMLWLAAVAVVALFIRRRARLAVYLTVTGLGALLLDPSLKIIVARLRPVVDVPVATAPGNSFPSGHALGSFVVYGALLLVFLPAMSAVMRRIAVTLVAVLVVAIGFTRVALGVHFASDVLAGWLLGAAWLGVTAYGIRLWQIESGERPAPLSEGIDPDAADDIAPAPDEGALLPHPWVKAFELATGWVLVFGVLYLVGVAVSRYAGGTFVEALDTDVPAWFAARRTPSLDDLSWLASKAGDTHAITAVALVACPLAVALTRRWRPVLFIVLVMFGELSLFLASAAAVDRPRPRVENLDGAMPTSSFPSGHIAATMCLYTALAILALAHTRRWWRWAPVALAVLMPVIVATSRMYRGMHHPSDVFGALVLTALLVPLVWWVVRPTGTESAAPAAGDGAPADAVTGGLAAGAGDPPADQEGAGRAASGDDLQPAARRTS